ncbi:DcaP family trimeric outer membrane transporter [Phenylobacterium sp. J367]|uniref:DcaP family trimeric outer membrane transporter n=1 Tax=Phenylobacterium sp. J367 TaxID=2898435 RepID=UPI002150D797|nr:DcaP family trimeric outer membrane transporter [Phenylobacterium sp. J367]MCR5878820.1 DcaP family trimeric outer membrane transporter [Phenylobacterium sp. J367]
MREYRPCRPRLLLAASTAALLAGASAAHAQDGPSFEVYGFAQVDYTQDFDRVHPKWDDALRPSKIPTEDGIYGDDGQTSISVKQSRFGVRGGQEVGGQQLDFRFEFDLFGVGGDEGQTTFRLRHAYGSWGPILAGQTNSVFMDGDTFPNTVEYWGPNGMVFLRNPQIRFTHLMGPSQFAVAVEKPGNDIDPGNVRQLDPAIGDNLQGDEKLPDLTAHWRYGGDWGHFQLAGILRRVGYETAGTPDNKPKDHKTGWGVNASSNIKTWGKDVAHLSVVYGEGIASYMNDGGTDLGPKIAPGAPNPLPVPPPPGSLRGDVLPMLGVMLYYDHYWNDTWSSSFGWSMNKVDNTSFQDGSAYKKGQYASANILYTPAPALLFGAEFLWGQREDFDGAKGEDVRLQLTAKYSFSSKDFFN